MPTGTACHHIVIPADYGFFIILDHLILRHQSHREMTGDNAKEAG